MTAPTPDEAAAPDPWWEMLTEQTCPAKKHVTWYVDSEWFHACPWCERDSLRAEVERAQSGATSWRDMAWSLTKATEKRDAAVRALHQELDALHNHDEDGNCFACDRPWPCPTVKALNRAALGPVETPQEDNR